ncbi:hypothetical protein PUN28_002568 [Cardiocondyla obscurior]
MIDKEINPLQQLLDLLLDCYKFISSGDDKKAAKKINKAEELLIKIQHEKEYNQIIRVIEHVFYATKCFFLYDANVIVEIQEILPNIVDTEQFNDIELGALYGCQSVIWMCMGDFGVVQAIDTAKKALEKNQDCALWHFIFAKSLRRQRRLISLSIDVSDLEKKHFEIAYATSTDDVFGIYYLQMRLESFYKFCRDRNYVMRKNENEKDVTKIAKQILQKKPKNFKVLLKLARIFLRVSSDESLLAKECLDTVETLVPDNITCFHYKAILYEGIGEYKEALYYYKKAAEHNNFAAELYYVQYGWEVGELEPLPHLLRMLKKYDPIVAEKKISLFLAIATTHYSLRKDMLNAADYFLKALSVDPLNTKFKNFYKFLDFTTTNISYFLKNVFCPNLEKNQPKMKITNDIKNLLDGKHVDDLIKEMKTLSVNTTEKH